MMTEGSIQGDYVGRDYDINDWDGYRSPYFPDAYAVSVTGFVSGYYRRTTEDPVENLIRYGKDLAQRNRLGVSTADVMASEWVVDASIAFSMLGGRR